MTDEGFDDNDDFGAIDGETSASESNGKEDGGDDDSVTDTEVDSKSSSSEKRKKPNKTEDDLQEEEPLEACKFNYDMFSFGILHVLVYPCIHRLTPAH